MFFEKIYSCGSKVTIEYKKLQPYIDYKFSYTRDIKSIDEDYNLFSKKNSVKK